jgi:hypothetical protein
VTHHSVGDVSITLEPVVAAAPNQRARTKADVGGVLSEYGGAAIEKLLNDSDDTDDDYVVAVKA